MLRKASYVVVVTLALADPIAAQAQRLSPDTLDLLDRVRRTVTDRGASLGPRTWPGFRPDTIPVVFVLPGRGTVLAGWRGELPTGFTRADESTDLAWRPEADRAAASTSTVLDGRRAAQVVVSDLDLLDLAGLAVHEAFHVFQRAEARDGRRFGDGENSFLVSRYPEFDVENEAAFRLEGRLLEAALEAETDSAARTLAREFTAVREARQRRLSSDLAEFEAATEMNEGLAEYALTRMRMEAGASDPAEARRPIERLSSFLDDPTRSVRLRFYATGTAIALLLDRFAGAGWQASVMERNVTLQDGLAAAVGFRDPETALRESGRDRFRGEGIDERAAGTVDRLLDLRRARADSIMTAPGIHLIVAAARGMRIGMCGIDPINLLQAGEGILLHTRWVHLCSGSALDGELNTPSIQDRTAGTWRAAVGSEEEVIFTAGGERVRLGDGDSLSGLEDLKIESPVVTLRLAKADLERAGRVITVRPVR